jgi:hypothetical protein
MQSITPEGKGYKLHDFRTNAATEKAIQFLNKLQEMEHPLMNPKNKNQLKKLQIVVSKHIAGGQRSKKDLAKIKIPEKYLLNNPKAAKTLQISSIPLNNTYKNAFDSYISPSVWIQVENYMRDQMTKAAAEAAAKAPKQVKKSKEPYTHLELFENVNDLAERVHYVNPPKKSKNNGKNKKIRREIDNLVERSYQKSFEDNNRSENWVQGIIEKSKIELQKQEDDDDNPIDSHLESQYEERFESDD